MARTKLPLQTKLGSHPTPSPMPYAERYKLSVLTPFISLATNIGLLRNITLSKNFYAIFPRPRLFKAELDKIDCVKHDQVNSQITIIANRHSERTNYSENFQNMGNFAFDGL